jgi:pyroglutamyl-peptidase
MMPTTILVTGFGPFPGAPFNPTGPLVKRLARLRMARTKIVTHIFETSYAAVDRDLPKLMRRYKPDAILMFGLAPRARVLRIETRAQNALARLVDASGATPKRAAIVDDEPPAIPMRLPARRLLTAVRKTGVRARLSRDAGTYLCNYLCWRAAETAARNGGPRLAVFVHVPLPARKSGTKPYKLTLNSLARAAKVALVAVVASIRPKRLPT